MRDALGLSPVILNQPDLAGLANQKGQVQLNAIQGEITKKEKQDSENDALYASLDPKKINGWKTQDGAVIQEAYDKYISEKARIYGTYRYRKIPLEEQKKLAELKYTLEDIADKSDEHEKYAVEVRKAAQALQSKGLLDTGHFNQKWNEFLSIKDIDERSNWLINNPDMVRELQGLNWKDITGEISKAKGEPYALAPVKNEEGIYITKEGKAPAYTRAQIMEKSQKIWDDNLPILDKGNKKPQELYSKPSEIADELWGFVDKGDVRQGEHYPSENGGLNFNFGWGSDQKDMSYQEDTQLPNWKTQKSGSHNPISRPAYSLKSQVEFDITTNDIYSADNIKEDYLKKLKSGKTTFKPIHIVKERDGSYWVVGNAREAGDQKSIGKMVWIPYNSIKGKMESNYDGTKFIFRETADTKTTTKTTKKKAYTRS